MKLLFDQNISYRILKKIGEDFPGPAHVTRTGLNRPSDLQIWEYAKTNGFIIVTFDEDFFPSTKEGCDMATVPASKKQINEEPI